MTTCVTCILQGTKVMSHKGSLMCSPHCNIAHVFLSDWACDNRTGGHINIMKVNACTLMMSFL